MIDTVRSKCLISPVVCPAFEFAILIEDAKEHFLVIAREQQQPSSILKGFQLTEYPTAVGSVVDHISERNYLVVRTRLDGVQHRRQSDGTTMDVANRDDAFVASVDYLLLSLMFVYSSVSVKRVEPQQPESDQDRDSEYDGFWPTGSHRFQCPAHDSHGP